MENILVPLSVWKRKVHALHVHCNNVSNLFKNSNKTTGTTPYCSGLSILNFKQISLIALVLLYIYLISDTLCKLLPFLQL